MGADGRPPWARTPRADDHDALERLLRETPEGAPVIWLARTLFGDDVAAEDKDWKFVKRHCERYHHVFKPTGKVAVPMAESDDPDKKYDYENWETEPDLVWVSPTGTPSGGVFNATVSGISEHRGESAETGDESVVVATANAAGILGRRRTFDTAAEWGALVGAFGAKRTGEDAGERQATRFNAVERARESPNRVAVAFAGARELNHSRGAVVTATTDPGRFDSSRAAAGSLLYDVNQLRRKVGRPPGVTVVEPTERGVGHAHIGLFGVDASDLPSTHELHRYWWETRERGHQVDVQPIAVDGEVWSWAEQAPDAADGCPPDAYLREGPVSVATVAHLNAEKVQAVANGYRDRGDAAMDATTAADVDAAVAAETGVDVGAVRRAAWYFGTGLKAATRPSKAMREAVETDGRDGAA